MMYESLSEIKLSTFIKIATGDIKAVIKSGEHTDEECKERSSDLILEYMDICATKSVLFHIEKSKRVLQLKVRKRILEICKVLLAGELYEDVVKILSEIGYRISKDDHEKINMRVNQLSNKCDFDLKMLENDKSDETSVKSNDFTRERVSLMSHYKMHIDPEVYTAEEYAFLVSMFNKEIEEMKKKSARMNK